MYLLDTSLLIWWLTGNTRLLPDIRKILDESHSVYVSAASIWEISIKSSIRKLKVPKSFFEDISNSQFIELPISFTHAKMIYELPHLHKDPFDRILIVQAQHEGLTIITHDPAIARYEVACRMI